MGKYSRWYGHRGIRYEEVVGWDTCEIIYKCRPDQRYGYAGVSSRSWGGSRSRFRTTQSGHGDKVSRFEVWYARHPGGGALELLLDGEPWRTLETRSETHVDAIEAIEVEDGAHELVVVARGGGETRTYGVVLEREGPGVVWDELSLIGSFTQRLDYQSAEHLAGQLAGRDVHLLVFILGGNDLSRAKTDLRDSTERYEREYARVLSKFREGKPDAACLIMATTDHGFRVGGSVRSRPFVQRLAEAQRAVAMDQGCAFYDTFLAMGGTGSVARWRADKPPLIAPDLGHLTLAGQRKVGGFLYAALMRAYADYRRRSEGQLLPELSRRVPVEEPLPLELPKVAEPPRSSAQEE
jgi:lysophospholipase L1-like esterase